MDSASEIVSGRFDPLSDCSKRAGILDIMAKKIPWGFLGDNIYVVKTPNRRIYILTQLKHNFKSITNFKGPTFRNRFSVPIYTDRI